MPPRKKKPAPVPAISENCGLQPVGEIIDYTLEAFIPISETASDKETTESDLAQLNNHLAIFNGVLPHVRTIQGLVAVSGAVCKLIETRRKVKKLEYGAPVKGSKSPYEVLE